MKNYIYIFTLFAIYANLSFNVFSESKYYFFLKIAENKYQVGIYEPVPVLTLQEIEECQKTEDPVAAMQKKNQDKCKNWDSKSLLLKDIYITGKEHLPQLPFLGSTPLIFDSLASKESIATWDVETISVPPFTWKAKEIIPELSLANSREGNKYFVGVYMSRCLPKVYFAFYGCYIEFDDIPQNMPILNIDDDIRVIFVNIPISYLPKLAALKINVKMEKNEIPNALQEELERCGIIVDLENSFPPKTEIKQIDDYNSLINDKERENFIKSYTTTLALKEKKHSVRLMEYSIQNQEGDFLRSVNAKLISSALPFWTSQDQESNIDNIHERLLVLVKNSRKLSAYFSTNEFPEVGHSVIREEKINGIQFHKEKVILGEFQTEDTIELSEIFLNLSVDRKGVAKIWTHEEKDKIEAKMSVVNNIASFEF